MKFEFDEDEIREHYNGLINEGDISHWSNDTLAVYFAKFQHQQDALKFEKLMEAAMGIRGALYASAHVGECGCNTWDCYDCYQWGEYLKLREENIKRFDALIHGENLPKE